MTAIDPVIALRRPRPVITHLNRGFWDGCAAGELRIQRCTRCGRWQHPPRGRCSACLAADVRFEATSGRGTVFSFTIVHHAFRPGLATPYLLALVELAEQDCVRLTTNIVGCVPDAVTIGMPVQVTFETQDDGFAVPLFEPIPLPTNEEPS